jgi:multimeric flavodoxin WrbA
MKVLLLNGSPHEKGCTYTGLNEVAMTLQKNGIDTEIFWLGNKEIHSCLACGKCRETGKCVFDDVVNEIGAKLADIDGIVLGSPTHYASASGAITTVMDRVMFSASGKLAKKPGAVVITCRRGGASAAFDQLNKYFSINNMPIATSQYWNQIHGNTPEEVKQDLEGLQTLRTLATNMAWLLKCIEAGRKAGVPEPAYEETIKTNFVR